VPCTVPTWQPAPIIRWKRHFKLQCRDLTQEPHASRDFTEIGLQMPTVFYVCPVVPTVAFGYMYLRLLFVRLWNQIIHLYWGLGCNGIKNALFLFKKGLYCSVNLYNKQGMYNCTVYQLKKKLRFTLMSRAGELYCDDSKRWGQLKFTTQWKKHCCRWLCET
jgi:hypothetical protein